MELSSNLRVPDGLVATITLLNEKPRHGVTSWESALHPGIDERNCMAAIGLLFRSSEIVSGTVVAPNEGMSKTPQQCAGEALKKNAVALSLDVAGVRAGFLPGGDLVVAGAQATISVASGVNSAVHGDGIGSDLGVLGLPATSTSYAAKATSVGGKALPEWELSLAA